MKIGERGKFVKALVQCATQVEQPESLFGASRLIKDQVL